ncbi:MAG TPA: hypothetical protein DEA80_07860 [Afipia sp.]|nr:hypothetical protein [Afipia sp.]OUX62993.1 MAG: hypothetical protein CBB64_01570 [Afipia sp. TMED4]HBF54007.1 hypothetical protein [Afipia sp.]HBR44827.1 hypothetical protein [Afipia sp.]HCX18313.1 hypothetical protein [Afipia sp.]
MSNFRNRAGAEARKRAEQAQQPSRSTKNRTSSDDSRVSSTWTGQVRVTDRELEVLELYLGEALDRLFGLAGRPKARGPPD